MNKNHITLPGGEKVSNYLMVYKSDDEIDRPEFKVAIEGSDEVHPMEIVLTATQLLGEILSQQTGKLYLEILGDAIKKAIDEAGKLQDKIEEASNSIKQEMEETNEHRTKDDGVSG